MKKIVASVGLVALGASGIQTASGQALSTPDTSKPWSVAATLRGFYDDNVGTVPNNVALPDDHRGTYGFEVSPSATLTWAMEQTTINMGVLYSLKYYGTTPPGSTSHDDQSVTFNAGLTHDFSESWKARVSDSFVLGQEPDMLRAGNTFATFQRVSGDNIRNYGSLGLDGQLSPDFGVGVGYDNAFYDYKATGPLINGAGDVVQPSIAGALNRIEHRAHLEGLYQLAPETKAILGYQFTEADYTANELVAGSIAAPIKSDFRNYREHTVYLGADHNFLPEFNGAVRVGASYNDYYNSGADATYTPYVNATLKYTYAPESYVAGGFTYDRNATDVVGLFTSGSTTLDAESATVFASINHRIMPRLFGSVLGQFQNSTYNGGQFDGKSEQFYLAGVNLEYRFNQYFAADVGYNYDRLESGDLGRTFDRNRVYIGVTASY